MDPIDQLIADWEPAIRKAFEESVSGIRDRVVLNDIVRMLEAGDVDGALRAVGIEPAAFRPLDSALHRAFEASGVTVAETIDRQHRANLVRALFDIRDPRAETWIRNHATTLIADIVAGQEQIVRQTFNAGIVYGRPAKEIALDLVGRINRVTGKREGGVLGLTPQQEAWVRNYEAELARADPAALTRKLRDKRFDAAIRKAIRTGKSIPAADRLKFATAYRNRALRYRAETIVQAEADAIIMQGQSEAWRQAIARGAVQYDQVKRFWVTMGDDKVRPDHAAVPGLNPAGVGLDQPFQTPKGLFLHPGWDFDPGCRCRERIKVVAVAQREPLAA